MKVLPPWILMLALGSGMAQASPVSPARSDKPQAPHRLSLTPQQRTQLAQASREDIARWLAQQTASGA